MTLVDAVDDRGNRWRTGTTGVVVRLPRSGTVTLDVFTEAVAKDRPELSGLDFVIDAPIEAVRRIASAPTRASTA